MSSPAPLRDRFQTAPVVPSPQHPEIVQWRPAHVADIDALWELRKLAAAIEDPGLPCPRSFVSDRFERSSFDPESDSLVALDAEGTILGVAYVDRADIAETVLQLWLSGDVRPSHRRRGMGTQLVAWQKARAEQVLAQSELALPGWICFGASEQLPGQIRLAENFGFQIARYFTDMTRELGEEIAEPVVPEGTRIVPFAPELAEATLVAFNDSFRDHWGHQPESAESWALQVAADEFEPAISRVAVTEEEPSRVAGFVLAHRTEDGQRAYIGLIGVIRDYRRRGVAPALIAASLRAQREAGVQRTTLDVDSASPTSANTLYSRLGFVPGNSTIVYLREY